MRKWLRAIARARMEREGVRHINRKLKAPNGAVVGSYFSANWRRYAKQRG